MTSYASVVSARSRSGTFYVGVLSALLGVVLGVRLIGLSKGIWLDEYVSLSMISQGSLSGMLQALKIDNHPPLYFVLLLLWSRFSTDEAFLRILSVVFSGAALLALALWLKRYSRMASGLAVLFLGTTPMMLRYAQEIRPYGLLILLAVVAYFSASRLLGEADRNAGYVWLAVCLTLAVSTHLLGMMLTISVAAFMGASFATGRASIADRRRLVRLLAAFMAPVIAFSAIYLLYLTHVQANTSDWWVPQATPDFVLEQLKALFGTDQLFHFGALVHAQPVLIDRAVKVLLAICGIALLAPWGWRRSWPLFLAALVYWLEILAYSWLITPMWYYRTILVGLVPFAAFAAVKLSGIAWRPFRAIAMACFALICAMSLVSWLSLEAHTPIEPWRQVSQSLAAERRSGDLVIFYPGYIQGVVLYYDSTVPEQSVLGVEINAPVAERIQQVEDYVSQRLSPGYTPAVFLVLRDDLSVAKDQKTYQALTGYLNDRFGPRTSGAQYGIVSVSRFAVPGNNN